MTNPQQNALAEALERKMARVHPSNRKADLPMMIKMTYGDLETIVQALASNNPAAVEGQGEGVCAVCKGARDDLAQGRDPEELCDPCYDDAVAELASALAPAPGQWQDPYRSERTDAVLTRLASQDTELARESIEVISLLRHEQDRLRDENLTLGARVLELEDADREPAS